VALRTLQKWHAAGNDFLVEVIEHGTAPWWTPERVRALCARATGVGADGLLLATLGSEVSMVLYNADGSLAEMSGNGIRCLAAAVRRATHASWDTLKVRTDAGVREVGLSMDEDAGIGRVSMGTVSIAEALEGTLGVARVGNPHVVVRDEPEWDDAQREARAAAWSSSLGGANVEFVTVTSPDRIELRVIERGVGWTLACGTGACAAAAVLHRAGEVSARVVVASPGGELEVSLEGESATLAGPVQFVANVEWLEA
jgi:diaminopimelate epimerase